MATITLKNVPDSLHVKLRQQAERNRRSLNQEAIECLERATFSVPVTFDMLTSVVARQRALGVDLTGVDIDELINEGHD